ncbi:MAG TPA: biofilm regulation protein kinase SiaB [Armatimonadota bacterium]|jgi:hypothetical protein
MNHDELLELREAYNEKRILLCFNGPFSQGLIEEIGSALKWYLESESTARSSSMDIFAVYVEIAQNIREYSAARRYGEAEASATVVVSRGDDGRYEVVAGNTVEAADAVTLRERIDALALLDKAELKAAYKQQLRRPRDEGDGSSAGLGLIDIARKSTDPLSCAVYPLAGGRVFFSLRVVV